jgi:hypothetical protein
MVRQLALSYGHSGRTYAAQPSFAYIYYADVNIVMSPAGLANAGTTHRTFPQNVTYRNIFKRESARRNTVLDILVSFYSHYSLKSYPHLFVLPDMVKLIAHASALFSRLADD